MLPYPRSWRETWIDSATGPTGLWRRHHPGEHFRTAAASTQAIAEMIMALLRRHPTIQTVVDLGAGGGELLSKLASADNLVLIGVDVRDRPARLHPAIRWVSDLWGVDDERWTTGGLAAAEQVDAPMMIMAVGWLDDLPGTVATATATNLAPRHRGSGASRR